MLSLSVQDATPTQLTMHTVDLSWYICRFMELKKYIKERRDALAAVQPGNQSSKKSQKGFA